MSVNLITGNLFSPIQASQDSDYQAGTFGEKTQILNVGSKMAVSIVDNSTIRCEDGVLVTREGRRVQIDNGDVVEWTIPTGTQGTTSYYIVGFRLYTDDESAQLCDTFVQLVSGPGATITEDTFRDGAVEIFVSVARVVQNGITLESVESLVPTATTLDQAKEDISRINSDLTWKSLPVTNLGCTIPSTAKEVVVSVWDRVHGIAMSKVFAYNTLNFSTQNGIIMILDGWYFSPSNCGVASIVTYPNNYLSLYSINVNGADVKNSTHMAVFYR